LYIHRLSSCGSLRFGHVSISAKKPKQAEPSPKMYHITENSSLKHLPLMASPTLTPYLPLYPSSRILLHQSPPFSAPHDSLHLTPSKSTPLYSTICTRPNKSCKPIQSVKVCSQLRYPIISPDDHWGTWTALFATGAFGIW